MTPTFVEIFDEETSKLDLPSWLEPGKWKYSVEADGYMCCFQVEDMDMTLNVVVPFKDITATIENLKRYLRERVEDGIRDMKGIREARRREETE